MVKAKTHHACLREDTEGFLWHLQPPLDRKLMSCGRRGATNPDRSASERVQLDPSMYIPAIQHHTRTQI